MTPLPFRARRSLTAVVAVALAFMAGGTAHAAGDASAPDPEPMRSLLALIGDAACDDDSQCRTLAVGAKACGGPEYYLAWSTRRTDAGALRAAAASTVSAPRSPKSDPRGQSTCVFVTDPGAYCAPAAGKEPNAGRGGTCRLRDAGRGVPGRVD